ncbi:MAG: hypothetical protein JSY10_30665, partial [Paenibacillus sp.]|nr:hypothetical protein [Paenibacillus sp.]
TAIRVSGSHHPNRSSGVYANDNRERTTPMDPVIRSCSSRSLLSFSLAGSLAVLVIEPLALGLGRSLGSILEHVFNYGSLLFGL